MEDNDNFGLYLNMKIYSSQSNGIFDKASNIYKEINTFIEANILNRLYLIITESNDIKGLEQQSYIKSTEKLLFSIRKENERFNLVQALGPKLILDNINRINDLIGFPIENDNNNNYNYYLSENNIINIGGLNFIIRKISIKGEIKNDKKQNNLLIDFFPENIKYLKCEICNELLVSFCNCQDFEHFNSIKNYINENSKEKIKENDKQTVKTYLFNLYKCRKCQQICPLKFKLLKNENKKENSNDIFNKDDYYKFVDNIEPTECDYLILESLGTINKENQNLIDKYIYVIKLTEEDIIIGKGKDNTILIGEQEKNFEKLCILKFDKNNKKIFIKNENENSDIYVIVNSIKVDKSSNIYALESNNKINILEKDMDIKVGKVILNVKCMKKYNFEKIRNDKSIYLLSPQKKME